MSQKRLQIITGSHHPDLAHAVATHLDTAVVATPLTRFANGEIKYHIEDSVRGSDVFVFQSHSRPVGEAIMEQAILIDAAKRASAGHITAVCPFLGYARQDRKSAGREPITAKLVINILQTAGADRIVSVDLHSGQIQGFFDGPFDHLIAMPVLVDSLKKEIGNNCVIVSPDAGRVKVAEKYADTMNAGLAIVHKRRHVSGNNAEALHVIGDVENQHCVIIDDMIDGGGTVCAAAALLKQQGAKSIRAVATHGLFSDPASERLSKSPIDRIYVTDTLPLEVKLTKPKIEVVSIAPLLADAISAIFNSQSVSALFDGQNHS